VILELLRRLTVKGGLNKVMEYTGPALQHLSVYERETICNMTQELGATSGLFPSDDQTHRFLRAQGRESDWKELGPDPDATYDEVVEIDLSKLEPLIAKPHSPDNVVPVREVAGLPVRQVAIGSSVNSGFTDLMRVAAIMKGKHVAPSLHATLSPGSRQILINLEKEGAMLDMAMAGVRGLEVACGPCIGMGAAPPFRGLSVRTFNRNFPGRSGTPDDQVYLCSPETAAATAIKGVITDPRDLGEAPEFQEPDKYVIYAEDFLQPPADATTVEVYMGPNIKPVPLPDPIAATVAGEVVLKTKDNISTDDILPGGAKVLPLRSNIPAISEYTYIYVDPTFVERARSIAARTGGFIVGGENYGQGSSREHAAIVCMYLGIKAVIAKSFARIHRSNLVNWGVLPLTFADPADYHCVEQGDVLELPDVRKAVEAGESVSVRNVTQGLEFKASHDLTPRQAQILLDGGLLNYIKLHANGHK
jgi:aconitate hydratase